MDSLSGSGFRTGDAAVRLHDQQRGDDLCRVQLPAQQIEVAAHMRHDCSIEDRSHAALEFAKLRQHVRRKGNHRLRILLRDDSCRMLFMQRIGVGMQKDHRNRRYVELPQALHRPPAVILMEGR